MGAINESVYDWDIAHDRFSVSESMQRVLGLPSEHLSLAGWHKRIHPEDFPAYRHATIAHLKGITERFEHDYRYRAADGTWRWARTHGVVIRNKNGRAVRMIGSTGDITELKRTQQQQTATAEILKVINSSLADVQPVFQTILIHASQLCEASFAAVFLYDGEFLTNVAQLNASPEFAAFLRRMRARPSRETTTRRCALERRTIHTPDLLNDPDFSPPQDQRRENVRTALSVPMVREGVLVGVVTLWRGEIRPFTEQQIALVETFADQAVIAIENARLFNETREALEQLKASAEILRVISSSIADTAPVFDKILESCERLFAGRIVGLNLVGEDNMVRIGAYHGPHREDFERIFPVAPGPSIVERRVVHYPDTERGADVPEQTRKGCRAIGIKSVIFAPLLWEERALGSIFVGRDHVSSFSEKDTALLKSFADQAVIAIQNARLFNETKEALDRQTAVSGILRVMASSPSDVAPVFESILDHAVHLCDKPPIGAIFRFDGELLHLVATKNMSPEGLAAMRKRWPAPPDSRLVSGRTVLRREVVRLEDNEADPEYDSSLSRAGGWRRMLGVPILKDGAPLGAFVVTWTTPGQIAERQVGLLETFAAQAAIAIENVRLFNETREALEQQRALAGVLGTMSGSIADTKPVFDQILDSCQRLFEGYLVGLTLAGEDGLVRLGAYKGENKEQMERVYPYPLARDSGTGQAVLDRKVVQFADVGAPGSDAPPHVVRGAQAVGFTSIIFAPLMDEGRAIGALWVARRLPGSFGDKQVVLLETFADQAVIAIRNVRLFNEVREALEQQTATAEILKVISASPTDTRPVFDAIVHSGLKLFSDAAISIALPDGDKVRAAAVAESDPARAAAWRSRFPFALSGEYMHGAAILERRVVDIPDVREAPPEMAPGAANFLASGYRGITIMPMMRGEEPIGALSVVRAAPGPLSDKQMALLKTFADQAVIAIENVRLFNEIQEKSRQLEAANRHKSEFLANMSHELRTPLNAVIGFTRIVMRRSREQLEPKQYDNLEKILSSAGHLLALINAVLDLSKVEAGRVEVVASEVPLGPMLEQCMRTVEPLVKAPAVRLLKEFDGALPQVRVDEEKLRQILLNLLSNALKFTEHGTVRVRAECGADAFSVAVADTGIGIPADKLEHVFEEFAQADASSTRLYGGTGLGLSIARRLARLMGGDIAVRSAPGAGSTFTLTLPLRYPA
jgi:PAS domain S-box-containing protein